MRFRSRFIPIAAVLLAVCVSQLSFAATKKNVIQLPAFNTPNYACDGLRRVALQRKPSPVNGGSDVILHDQGGAEYMGDPAGLVGWQAQSTLTVVGALTILPCKAEGGPAPVMIKGDWVKFRVDDSRRLVYVEGVGSVSQGTVTTKLKSSPAAGAAPGTGVRKLEISSGAKLTTHQHFLLLEPNDPPGAGARHVMVLRRSLIEKLRNQDQKTQYDAYAAEIAGILYAARSGQPMDKADLAVAGHKVAAIATVRRFDNASDLLASIGVPEGWNEPIVAVMWQDAPPSRPSGTTSAGGGATETQSFFHGSSATNIMEGQGTDFIKASNGQWLVLTGDVMSSKTADNIVVGKTMLRVTPDTRVCAKDGKRIALRDIPVGEKVLTVNARGDNRAQTVRVGVMQSRLREPSHLERIDNYSCN